MVVNLVRRDTPLDNLATYRRFVFLNLVVLAFASTQVLTGWSLLKYWKIAGTVRFMDLNSVLQSADCYQNEGLNIYSHQIGEKCAYNYGSVLIRTLNALRIGEASTFIFGLVGILVISCALSIVELVSRKKTFSQYAFILTLFLSPPILLLMERGNVDTLILACLILLIALIIRGKVLLSFIVITLMTLFKFYPIVLFGLIFIKLRNRWTSLLAFGLISLVSLQILKDIARGPGYINIFWASFGSPIWGIYAGYIGIEIDYRLSIFLGACIFLVLLLLVNIWLKSRESSVPRERIFDSKSVETLFTYTSTIFIFCYLLGMNFDYRLVFFLICNLMLIFASNLNSHLITLVKVLVIPAFWFSYNLHELQPIGDLSLAFLVAINALALIRILLNQHYDNYLVKRFGNYFTNF
jgi:hypothetical protein